MKPNQLTETTGIPTATVRQSHTYDCGPAALRSIATSYGVGPETEKEFIEACHATPDKGTTPTELAKAAGNIGLHATIVNNMTLYTLRRTLDKGQPVICAIQAWGDREKYSKLEDGHYVVAIAHDTKHIYFEDPSMIKTRGHLTHSEFQKRWHDRDAKGDLKTHLGIVVTKNEHGLQPKNLGDSKQIP